MQFLKTKIEKLIYSHANTFFSNVQPSQIQVGLFEGHLSLNNLTLRPEALLNQGSIPIKLVSGKINKVSIDIPWTNLYSEEVKIMISGVEIALAVKSLKEINYTREEALQSILNGLKKFMTKELDKELGSGGWTPK